MASILFFYATQSKPYLKNVKKFAGAAVAATVPAFNTNR
jgi:hypothetical protein